MARKGSKIIVDQIKKKYKRKLIIASFTSPVFLIIILIIVIIFSTAIMMGSDQFENVDYEVPEKQMKRYESVQEELKDDGINMPMKYIYGVDVEKRGGDLEGTAEVTKKDMVCFSYEVDDEKKVYEEKDKQKVYDCMDYYQKNINIFEYAVSVFTKFGEDTGEEIEFLGNFIRPIQKGIITNEFMGVDLGSAQKGHTGIDIGGAVGEPIYAAADGTVIRSGFQIEAGNNVIIKHNIDGKDFVTFYGHMKETPLVKVGDKVTVNTKLGYLGATGNVTGPHVHFEIQVDTKTNNHDKAVNPREYIDFPQIGIWFNDRGESGTISKNKEEIMKKAGVSTSDYGYADYIISHESTWNYRAVNPSSGAYGLCQALPPEKLASAGEDWKTNPITQMKWCDSYAKSRYGSWKKARNFWYINHWW